MPEDGAGERGWLRPLGLLLISLTLAIGQPIVLVAVAFAMLTFVGPGGHNLTRLLAAMALAMVFMGTARDGFWYLERGWAVLVAGWFVALSLAWPARSFLNRGVLAVTGGTVSVGVASLVLGGWGQIEFLMAERVQEGISASLQVLAVLAEGEVESGLRQWLDATGQVQRVMFPALVGLSSLASLGVAWWLHARMSRGTQRGLRGLRDFRFPDALIWVFIVGLGLLLLTEWSAGWGRLGTNLVAFMGALYVLRGAGVLMFLSGGFGVAGGLLLTIGLVLAWPIMAVGAMLVGVGDSWFDLRSRVGTGANGGVS